MPDRSGRGLYGKPPEAATPPRPWLHEAEKESDDSDGGRSPPMFCYRHLRTPPNLPPTQPGTQLSSRGCDTAAREGWKEGAGSTSSIVEGKPAPTSPPERKEVGISAPDAEASSDSDAGPFMGRSRALIRKSFLGSSSEDDSSEEEDLKRDGGLVTMAAAEGGTTGEDGLGRGRGPYCPTKKATSDTSGGVFVRTFNQESEDEGGLERDVDDRRSATEEQETPGGKAGTMRGSWLLAASRTMGTTGSRSPCSSEDDGWTSPSSNDDDVTQSGRLPGGGSTSEEDEATSSSSDDDDVKLLTPVLRKRETTGRTLSNPVQTFGKFLATMSDPDLVAAAVSTVRARLTGGEGIGGRKLPLQAGRRVTSEPSSPGKRATGGSTTGRTAAQSPAKRARGESRSSFVATFDVESDSASEEKWATPGGRTESGANAPKFAVESTRTVRENSAVGETRGGSSTFGGSGLGKGGSSSSAFPPEVPGNASPPTVMHPLFNGAALNKKQKLAVRRAGQGRNILVTGAAGTGKSYCMGEVVKVLRLKHAKVGVVATTGVAAVNLDGEAQTLNSYLGIGRGEGTPEEVLARMPKEAKLNWVRSGALVIDEVSMMSAKTLDLLDSIGRMVRTASLPMGGLQLVFVGDFFQLAPVVGEMAYTSEVWRSLKIDVVELTDVVRQEGDPKLVKMLRHARVGLCSAFDLQAMSGCSRRNKSVPRGGGSVLPTLLFATNLEVGNINNQHLAELPGEGTAFHSRDDYRNCDDPRVLGSMNANLQRMAPQLLILKVGAQVMSTKNFLPEVSGCSWSGSGGRDRLQRVLIRTSNTDRVCHQLASNVTAQGIVNGSRGVVVRLWDDCAEVQYANGRLIEHFAVSFDMNPHGGRGAAKGTRVQMPLALAWATTIHKSQGSTIDFACIDVSKVGAYGQAYVAVSRLTSFDGMHLRGPLTVSMFKVDPSVLKEFPGQYSDMVKEVARENFIFEHQPDVDLIGSDGTNFGSRRSNTPRPGGGGACVTPEEWKRMDANKVAASRRRASIRRENVLSNSPNSPGAAMIREAIARRAIEDLVTSESGRTTLAIDFDGE